MLGQVAGWAGQTSLGLRLGAGLTGLASRRVAGWSGPGLRHVRQAWPAGGHAFQDKKAFLVFGGGRQNFGWGRGKAKILFGEEPLGAEAN